MVIVIIRRFVRPGMEQAFKTNYDEGRAKASADHAFRGESLTKLTDDAVVPPGLRSLPLEAKGCVTYLNIARWDSCADFLRVFPKAGEIGGGPEPFETAERERAVLDVVDETAWR